MNLARLALVRLVREGDALWMLVQTDLSCDPHHVAHFTVKLAVYFYRDCILFNRKVRSSTRFS